MGVSLPLSCVCAAISFVVADSKLFAPFRGWLKRKSKFFGSLVSCGFCLGVWVAALLVLFLLPWYGVVPFLLTSLTVAWWSGLQWAAMAALVKAAGK